MKFSLRLTSTYVGFKNGVHYSFCLLRRIKADIRLLPLKLLPNIFSSTPKSCWLFQPVEMKCPQTQAHQFFRFRYKIDIDTHEMCPLEIVENIDQNSPKAAALAKSESSW